MVDEPPKPPFWRRVTVVEWLVILAIVAVLTALIVPETQWASDGILEFPVRVIVFDAEKAQPISGAEVALTHLSPVTEVDTIPDPVPKTLLDELSDEHQHRTGDDGSVTISYNFHTGASNRSPRPKAFLRWEWVIVRAQGYGTVVLPVRHDSMETKTLRELRELIVPVGLIRER
jgi:hypothetical protein